MRVRDILHSSGLRLRLTLAHGSTGDEPVVQLGDPDRPGSGAILLELYGAELLAAFLISARLSAVGELADESCGGDYPLMIGFTAGSGAEHISLVQFDTKLVVARPLWERLYTELQLVLAHGRNVGSRSGAGARARLDGRRLLH